MTVQTLMSNKRVAESSVDFKINGLAASPSLDPRRGDHFAVRATRRPEFRHHRDVIDDHFGCRRRRFSPCMENPPRILISRLVFELVSIIRSLRLNRLAVPANPAPHFDLGQGVVRW